MMTYMLSQYADLPLSQKTLAGWLEKWIYEQERRCTDEAFSAQFPWQETGLPQHDFLQRKLRIAGRHFLTGPRYHGGDINRPFIDIVASDSDINPLVLQAVSQEWAQLKPEYIRILTPFYSNVQGITDQLIYASRLSSAAEYQDDALTLRPAVYADFEWCRQALVEAYQHTWRSVPALTNRNLNYADDEDLIDNISQGEVYIIYEHANRAGLIICEKGEIAFLPGCKISEEIILPDFRGHSLASRAQRLLFNCLSPTRREDSLLMGTIIPDNLPSIKTAERAGRSGILRYQFLPVIDR
ncbi:GNAT family N-acetyltransferase [Klebsiella electrica]